MLSSVYNVSREDVRTIEICRTTDDDDTVRTAHFILDLLYVINDSTIAPEFREDIVDIITVNTFLHKLTVIAM